MGATVGVNPAAAPQGLLEPDGVHGRRGSEPAQHPAVQQQEPESSGAQNLADLVAVPAELAFGQVDGAFEHEGDKTDHYQREREGQGTGAAMGEVVKHGNSSSSTHIIAQHFIFARLSLRQSFLFAWSSAQTGEIAKLFACNFAISH